MKLITKRFFVLRIAFCVAAVVMCGGARVARSSPPPPVYDLNSLVWLSSAIVEAKAVRSERKGYETATFFRVESSFKGNVAKNQLLFVEKIDRYHKPREKPEKLQERVASQPIAIGDSLLLFLERPRLMPYDNKVFDAATWQCIDSGVRLLQENQFYTLEQMYYGSFGAHLEKDAVGQPLSADEFRHKVRQTIERVETWRQQINAPLDEKQARWLQNFIIEQQALAYPKAKFKTGNVASANASQRLASWNKPELLLETMKKVGEYGDRFLLQRGLATPQGREFLLSQLANTQQNVDVRLMLAHSLSSLGFDYSQSPDFAKEQTEPLYQGHYLMTPKSLTIKNPPSDNAQWIERLARVAIEKEPNSELGGTIFQNLSEGVRNLSYAEETVKTDWKAALQVLAAGHVAVTVAEHRFYIEKIAAKLDRSMLQKLNPQTGPLLSLCSAPEQKYATGSQSRTVQFSYQIEVLDAAKGLRSTLVLRHLETGQKYQLPFEINVTHVNSGIGGFHSLPIPEWFPRGRFHVFLQFSRGDEIVSRGYGFDTDL